MVYGLLKVNHLSSLLNEKSELDSDIDLESSFNPDLTTFSIDDMTDLFRNKIKKLNYFLSVREIYGADLDNPKDYGSDTEYYCKIIIKETKDGLSHFEKNKQHIDPKKHYTFLIRNTDSPHQKKLDDFYAVCALPHMKIRISFSKLK